MSSQTPTEELGYAETTASGGDDDKAPDASLDTMLAEGGAQPSTARPAERLALVDRGRYAEQGEMARGGLGRIVRAKDRHLGRTVALKEMLRGGAEAERRFVREALITARLEHPSIVPVHDAGRDDTGAPFYAMKMVGGRPLMDVFSTAATTSERLALVPRLLAVADAIAYAHSKRVIHRDLKPGNVICGEFGETVVIDWGLAKDLDAGEEPDGAAATEEMDAPQLSGTETVDGAILGTPAYMAPEQASGGEVDERVDVYAIGAMLYELLSGTPPHKGDTLDDVLRRVIAGDLEPLQRRVADVPQDLAAIVAKAMARDPAGRYRTAKELADDLRRYVTGQLVAVYRYGRLERLWRWVVKNRAAVAVALVATAILVVLGAIAIRRILQERDHAQAAREVAERAEMAARERGDDLLIEQARAEIAADPTRAVAILAGLAPTSSRWSAARVVAADARQRGIARVLVGHIWTTEAIALDGKGARVGSLGHDGIRVWDLPARTVRTLPLPAPCGAQPDCTFGGWTLAMSDDGRWLAAGAGAITRWDLTDLARWDLAGAAFAMSPPVDGTLLAVARDGRIAVRDAAGAIALVEPGGAREEVLAAPTSAAVASPGASTIVGVEPARLRIWYGGTVTTLDGDVDDARVVVSASGELVAWTHGTSLHVWTAAAGARAWEVPAPRHLAIAGDDTGLMWDDADGLAWLDLDPLDVRRGAAPAGTIAGIAAGADGDEMIVATDSAVTVAHADGHRNVLVGSHRPGRLAVSGNGRILAVTGTATVPVWTLEPDPGAIARGSRDPQPPSLDRGMRMVTPAEMATSRDGTTLLVDWGTGAVELWSRTGARLEKAGALPIPPLSDLSVSPDGKEVLWVDDDGAARTAGNGMQRLGPAQLGWFDPDGVAYTIDEEGAIRRWNTDATSEAACSEAALWEHTQISNDGSTIAAVAEGELVRCRLATGAVDTTAQAGTLAPWSLRDDGAAAAGFDKAAGQLVVLDGSGRHEVAASTSPSTVLLSPDGRWLVAVAGEGGFTIVDVSAATSRPVAVAGHMPGQVAFLPGDSVAVLSESGLVVADLATGASRTIALPEPGAALFTFSDGAMLVTAGDRVIAFLDDLPHDPTALQQWLQSSTDARIGPAGDLISAKPFREP